MKFFFRPRPVVNRNRLAVSADQRKFALDVRMVKKMKMRNAVVGAYRRSRVFICSSFKLPNPHILKCRYYLDVKQMVRRLAMLKYKGGYPNRSTVHQ
jgi:hypothetical protein